MKKSIQILYVLLLSTVIIIAGCSEKIENTAVSYDGVKISFEVRGEGAPAIVFVHGFASENKDWRFQMSYFSPNYKVAAVNLAGFGDSGNNRKEWTMGAFGEDVVSVIKHLKLEKVILVGQSMGTAVILEAALRIPERIIGLVPVDMLQNVESKRTPKETRQFSDRVWNGIINPDRKRLRSAFKRDIDEKIVDEIIHFYNSSSKIGWREAGGAFLQWMSDDLLNVLKKIQNPIFCINSDRRKTDKEIARKYVRSFDAVIIENTGHPVMLDAPDDFNQALEDIIRSF